MELVYLVGQPVQIRALVMVTGILVSAEASQEYWIRATYIARPKTGVCHVIFENGQQAYVESKNVRPSSS